VSELSHDEIVELLGVYSLDAIDPHEAAIVREHVERCRSCAGELADHHALAGMLGNSGDDAPSHLWERIASQIERPEDADIVRPVTLLFPDRSVTNRVPERPVAKAGMFKATAIFAIAAGIIVIAVLGFQIGRLDNRVGHLQAVGASQTMTQAADAVAANPDAHLVKLTAANSSGPTLAEIAVLPSGDAFLINDHLSSLPSDKTYQLWGRVGDQVVSLGLLGSDPLDVPFRVSPSSKVEVFAITEEVGGGVVRSTHSPVAVSALT